MCWWCMEKACMTLHGTVCGCDDDCADPGGGNVGKSLASLCPSGHYHIEFSVHLLVVAISC